MPFIQHLPLLFHSPFELQRFIQTTKSSEINAGTAPPLIGFVPTMGALHEGHLSLIRRAKLEVDCVIASIFVNPLQFGPEEDLEQYPRSLNADIEHCQHEGVAGLFVPDVVSMFPYAEMTTVLPPQSMTNVLCGRSRPGHFEGVATIVLKLLNLVQPDRVYMGQKDAQQLAIMKRMVADLNLNTTIVGCPIIREETGLALSSRNQYLSANEKDQAPLLFQALKAAQQAFYAGETVPEHLIQRVHQTLAQGAMVETEYVNLVDAQSLTPLNVCENGALLAIAAKIGTTRLIDNMILDTRKPIVAIDGPAGAGKSTVTRRCAEKLGLLYLDTGAMYRAVTWFVLKSQEDPLNEGAIASLLDVFDLQLLPSNDPALGMVIQVNGQDVTQAIRSQEVTKMVSTIAAQSAVREAMVKQQQKFGQDGGVIAEGRDIGTNVFPDATLKIFLTATIEERARRRHLELASKGETSISVETLAQNIAQRDAKDSSREIAPLCQAQDAIQVLTDGLSIDQVCQTIVDLYQVAVR